MIVVDASAVLELLLNTQVGLRVADRLFDADQSLHAPHLLDLEVAEVLRRYVSSKELNECTAKMPMTTPLQRSPAVLSR